MKLAYHLSRRLARLELKTASPYQGYVIVRHGETVEQAIAREVAAGTRFPPEGPAVAVPEKEAISDTA